MNDINKALKELRNIFKSDIIVILGVSKHNSFIMRVESKESFDSDDIDDSDFKGKLFVKKDSIRDKDSYIG